VPIMVVQGTLEMTAAGGSTEIATAAWDDQADGVGTLMRIVCFYPSFYSTSRGNHHLSYIIGVSVVVLVVLDLR
jgi:hypothetical protein